jgi:hypothetical protein
MSDFAKYQKGVWITYLSGFQAKWYCAICKLMDINLVWLEIWQAYGWPFQVKLEGIGTWYVSSIESAWAQSKLASKRLIRCLAIFWFRRGLAVRSICSNFHSLYCLRWKRINRSNWTSYRSCTWLDWQSKNPRDSISILLAWTTGRTLQSFPGCDGT